uniref:TSC22 domain family, member 1 n=1 Tax=Periophthalmus magnuspinnatus TaxID=409849 RepID=A0A3B3ZAF1_9GOBI
FTPPAADSGSGRKMAHQAVFHRRGSNTGSGSGTVLSPPTNAVVNNSHVAADEFQPALLIQCQPPAGSSSPGPHHPPPHSLNLLTQAQPAQATGALTKKKSGFQITSVTPAQVSVSTNNSIAEDTESYDDLDESHTEDLSSSEILDTSLSRANDVVGAERSSSEETLNNFHEAETPGAVSPNQPAHSLLQASTHSGAMVNGTIHHHHHHHHHQHHPNQAQAYAGNPQSAGALPNVTLKMPSNVGATQESVSQAAPPGVGVAAPGSVAGMQSSAVGTTVSIANPQSSSVSNVNMLSSANVPVRGGISTSASSTNLTTSTHATIIQHAPHTAAPQQSAPAHPAPAAGTTSSRFRVVKLDSSSEPFRKGRWTCTEFYDKEAPASAPSSSASDSSSVGVRQYVSESFAGPSDRETTSGSSVSSSVSTLSHYADSVCSGESTQHPQDYASPPTGFQPVAPGAMNHMFAQDPLSQVKTSVAQPNVHLPASLTALQSQQLTYAQAVASQPTGPGPVPVQPQKVNYPVPQQAAPVQGRPEYTQPLSNVVGSANSQMIGAPQPTPLQAPPVPSHVGQSHLDALPYLYSLPTISPVPQAFYQDSSWLLKL